MRELVDALVREQAVQVGPAAEVALPGEQLPGSLAGVLTDRLSSVSPETAQLLRAAALLGGRFAVTDLAVVLRQPASGLAAGLQEAVAAGILAGSGAELVFRHPLIRQALYESMPLALRTALHAEAARELAAAGADALSVAQQLSAAGRPGEGWARDWLIRAAPALTARAPQLAVELLRRELDETPGGGEAWDRLMVSLVWALLAAGSYQEAVRQASWALTVMTDPAGGPRPPGCWRAPRSARARATTRSPPSGRRWRRRTCPAPWRARMLALLPMLERGATGTWTRPTATARQALTAAEEAGDAFATAHALADLWLTRAVRATTPPRWTTLTGRCGAGRRSRPRRTCACTCLNVRIFTLQNLDQWPQAELALRQAREFALRTGMPDRVDLG